MPQKSCHVDQILSASQEEDTNNEMYGNCRNILEEFGDASYSDIGILCSALSSNVYDTKCITCKSEFCQEWVPRPKLYFFHSLSYHPETSIFAEHLIRCEYERSRELKSIASKFQDETNLTY